MSDETIRLIVQSEVARAVADLGKLQNGLSGTGEAADKSASGFDKLSSFVKSAAAGIGIATGVIVGAGVAVKKAFDFTEAGAQLVQTRESFDRLGISIENLRSKSGGTIDDLTLMSGALTTVAGTSGNLEAAMRDAYPQFIEIARAANKLNPSLGDTSYMLDSITLAAKRQSKLIADNLGIIVNQTSANEAYAASIGKSVDALTDEERQLAFVNGLLKSGAELIRQVGETVDGEADAWARVRAEIQNSIDAKKEYLAEKTQPFVEATADHLEVLRLVRAGQIAYSDAIRDTGVELGTGVVVYKELDEVLEIVAQNQEKVAAHEKAMQDAMGTTVPALEESSHATKQLYGEIDKYWRTLQTTANMSDRYTKLLSGQTSTTNKSGDAFAQYYNAINNGLPIMQKATEFTEEEVDAHTWIYSALTTEIPARRAIHDQMKQIVSTQENEVEVTVKSATAFEQYNAAIGEAIPNITQMGERHAHLDESVLQMSSGLYNAREAFDQYNAALGQSQGLEFAALAMNKLNVEAGLARQNFLMAAAALDEMNKKQFAYGLIESLREAGMTGQELASATDAILTRFGLLTEEEKSAQGSIDDLTAALLAGKIGPEAYAIAVSNLKNAIDGLDGRKITVDFEFNIPALPNIPGPQQPQAHASGGVSPGGVAWVGEYGPELVQMPPGTRVYDHRSSRTITNVYNLNARLGDSRQTLRNSFNTMRALSQ